MTARKSARKTTRTSARKKARRKATTRARPRKTPRVLAKAAKRLRAVGRKAGDVGENALRAATGKGWREWFVLLDRSGGKALNHRGIVALVGKVRGVSGWWQQTITVAYERARGLRRRYQTTSGFTANSSKTVAAPLADLYDAWVDDAKQRAWLGAPAPTVRKAHPLKSLRLVWHDGSRVNVGFVAKGPDKAQVALGHERLPNARAAAAYRKFWKEALGRLQTTVEFKPVT